MTKRAGRSVSNDPGFQAILQAQGRRHLPCRQVVGLSRARGARHHATRRTSRASTQSVEGGRREPAARRMIDCEHFFDGYKGNRAYALAVAAHRLRGRRALGGAVRHQRRHAAARGRARSSREVAQASCRARTSASTPTTIPRMRSPTRWRRCAPARARSRARSTASASAAATPTSTSIIPTLLLKSEFADRFETEVTPERLRKLTHASRVLDEILNRAPNRQAPYVGEARLRHQGRHPRLAPS